MDEDLIAMIHAAYPWASEATMDSIASVNPAGYNQAVQAMRKLGVQLDPFQTERAADKLKKETSKTVKALQRGEKAVSETLRTFDRDLDPGKVTVPSRDLIGSKVSVSVEVADIRS